MGLFGGFSYFTDHIGPFGDKLFTIPDKLLDKGQDIIDRISGKDAEEATKEAADAQVGFQQQIMDLLRPQVEFGQEQLPALGASSTVEGFGQNIGDILSGGALDPLIAEQQRAGRAEMSHLGLRRSSGNVKRAAQLPSSVAFNIESELNRRRQANAGIGQTGLTGTAGALGESGRAVAGGILGGAGARAQGTQNIIGLLGGIAGGL